MLFAALLGVLPVFAGLARSEGRVALQSRGEVSAAGQVEAAEAAEAMGRRSACTSVNKMMTPLGPAWLSTQSFAERQSRCSRCMATSARSTNGPCSWCWLTESCSDGCPSVSALSTGGPVNPPATCEGIVSDPVEDHASGVRAFLGGDRPDAPEAADVGIAVPWLRDFAEGDTGITGAKSATLRSAMLMSIQGGVYQGCIANWPGMNHGPEGVGQQSEWTLVSCVTMCRGNLDLNPQQPLFFGITPARVASPGSEARATVGHCNCGHPGTDAEIAAPPRVVHLPGIPQGEEESLDEAALLPRGAYTAEECASEGHTSLYEASGLDEFLDCRRGLGLLCLATFDAKVRQDIQKVDNHDFVRLRGVVSKAQLDRGVEPIEEQIRRSLLLGPLEDVKPGAGLSGSTFMRTPDWKFYLKTLRHDYVDEKQILKGLMLDGIDDRHANPLSLLIRAYGVYKIDFGLSTWDSNKERFYVMEDASGQIGFPQPSERLARGIPDEPWHEGCEFVAYDLKGRAIRDQNRIAGPGPIGQNREFRMRENERLDLTQQQCADIIRQADDDLRFLERHNVIDYSWFVTIRRGVATTEHPEGTCPVPACTRENRCFPGAKKTADQYWVTVGVLDYINTLNMVKRMDSVFQKSARFAKFSNYRRKMMTFLMRICPAPDIADIQMIRDGSKSQAALDEALDSTSAWLVDP